MTSDSVSAVAERDHRPAKAWRYCIGSAEKLEADLHVSVTLDEFSKPALDAQHLKEHITDQILYKYADWKAEKLKTSKTKASDVKIITVSQAWMWMVQDFVITATCKLPPEFPEMPRDSRYQNTNSHEDSDRQFRMRIGKYLSDLIDFPNQPEKAGLSENIFSTFERAISIIADRASAFLKLSITTRQQSSQNFGMEDFDVDREAEYLHDIVDLRGELAMIQSVFAQQEQVWKQAIRALFPRHWRDDRFQAPLAGTYGPALKQSRHADDREHTNDKPAKHDGEEKQEKGTYDRARAYEKQAKSNGDSMHSTAKTKASLDDRGLTEEYEEVWYIIARPQTQFETYRQRIARLDEDAARVEDSIKTTLDLRAKHATMAEAHATAQMSAAIFGFTIITIIFTPLSFMVSLFALPIRRFQANQVESRWDGVGGVYTTQYLGTYIGKTPSHSSLLQAILTLRSYRGSSSGYLYWDYDVGGCKISAQWEGEMAPQKVTRLAYTVPSDVC